MIKKIVIDCFFEQLEHTRGMSDILRNIGYDVVVSPYIEYVSPDFKIPKSFREEPCLVYGSIKFVKAILKEYPNMIALYSDNDYLVSSYFSSMPTEHFLNKESFFVTFKMFKDNKEMYYNFLNADKVFIKPNSGNKTFTGLVIKLDDFDYEINSLEKLTSVMDNTLILVSKAYEIKNEYRFIVVDKEVVSGSTYSENNKINIKVGYNENAKLVAEKIARLERENKPDLAFICDVAELSNGDFKVVELNAFSTADVYCCDVELVFDKVIKLINQEEYS